MKFGIKRVIISLTVAFSCILSSVQPASALSPSDYFDLSYTAIISPNEVTGTDEFTCDVIAVTVCTKNLPVTVSEAKITGDVIGENTITGETVTLNSSYTLEINPFPGKAGQSIETTQSVPLQFPSGSSPGKYRIVGEIIEAKVKIGLWSDITEYLPQNKNFGTVIYSSGSEHTPTPSYTRPAECVLSDFSINPENADTAEPITQTSSAVASTAAPGNHTVDVNGITTDFNVSQPVIQNDPNAPINWRIILAAAGIVVLACIITIVLVLRRRSSKVNRS